MNARYRMRSPLLLGLLLGVLPSSCGGAGDVAVPEDLIRPESVSRTAASRGPDGADTAPMPRQLDAKLLAELDAYIDEAMQRYLIPGAAVAVIQDGQVVHLRGFGVRDAREAEAVGPDTLMMIGSTGKSMTTLMMATVVDDGLIAWDTRAIDVLPWFETSDPQITPQMTLEKLACNCSGAQRRDVELFFTASDLDARGVVRSIGAIPFQGEFGKTYGYVNQLVAAGGYVAARAASAERGELLAQYRQEMKERVFDPIGMSSTTFSFEEVTRQFDHASPHGFNLDYEYLPLPLAYEQFLVPVAPAGAGWSTVRDLARYVVTQMQLGVTEDGKRIVSRANLEKTWTGQVPVAQAVDYGLGWLVGAYAGHRMLWHGGATTGFGAEIAFLPEARIGIATIVNVQGGNLFAGGVRARFLELAFERPFEADGRIAQAYAAMKERYLEKRRGVLPSIDPRTIRRYRGAWQNERLGEATLSLRGRRALFDTGELQSALGNVGEGRYVLLGPPLAGSLITLTDVAGRPTLIFNAQDEDQPGEYEFRAFR
jgi:CubicO group peptidase (beta-lactamase class C family)